MSNSLELNHAAMHLAGDIDTWPAASMKRQQVFQRAAETMSISVWRGVFFFGGGAVEKR